MRYKSKKGWEWKERVKYSIKKGKDGNWEVKHKSKKRSKAEINKNGKKSKYMKDPYYDTKPTTLYPKRKAITTPPSPS